jgi:hypothetical protein
MIKKLKIEHMIKKLKIEHSVDPISFKHKQLWQMASNFKSHTDALRELDDYYKDRRFMEFDQFFGSGMNIVHTHANSSNDVSKPMPNSNPKTTITHDSHVKQWTKLLFGH